MTNILAGINENSRKGIIEVKPQKGIKQNTQNTQSEDSEPK
jgi:hypothetical protein